MGPVADLLARARKAGLRLEAHGDRLRVTGPKSAESIVRKIQAHKAEVLAMIRAGDETHHDPDTMRRAFRAAGLPTEMPRDMDAARERLHRLLCHQAPRPEGVSCGQDLVILFGGRRSGPRLLTSYEPWPSDPGALPIRWRLASDPAAAWHSLAVNPGPLAEPGPDPLAVRVLGLLKRDGPMRPEDLAPQLGINPVQALRPLHQLEANGQVVRLPDARWQAVNP